VLPGLEDSKGALYEIGVADDGTFIGLTEDELEESIGTLRIMAASLGCRVNVLRRVLVGDCEWLDHTSDGDTARVVTEHLWVAEVYVKPNWDSSLSYSAEEEGGSLEGIIAQDRGEDAVYGDSKPATDQLRVSLTGATMSGKSSLLGSLTTGTLDNGRGKSRLSLLKHQHEIATGMTSSVTQELVGYSTNVSRDVNSTQVVNFASGDVLSWLDIHATCNSGPGSGRVVLLSDSAGHPRYRRTTVRGLIGWAPHWTLLCIPADNTEDTSGLAGSTPPPQEVLGLPSTDIDLSQEHLELCLKLDLPLVIAITKLDLASKPGLRSCLSKVLSALKKAGRRPIILPDANGPVNEADLSSISNTDLEQVRQYTSNLNGDIRAFVPIVLTSAVKGSGISKLHALLRELPIPEPREASSDADTSSLPDLFDIEDIYRGNHEKGSDSQMLVLSGGMRYGKISIGDEIVVGPFPTDGLEGAEHLESSPAFIQRPHIPTSRSFPGALSDCGVTSKHATASNREWRKVQVRSVRNLRLPVRTLQSGQVGTIGVVSSGAGPTSTLSRIRKGMVLSTKPPPVHRIFIADFARSDVDSLSIGASLVVYFNSVRASAKVIAGAVPEHHVSAQQAQQAQQREDDNGFAFRFDEDDGNESGEDEPRLLVTFQFLASREFVEMGTQVLVMPGGGQGFYGGSGKGEKGLSGLLGFVGKVVEVQ
jgi:GTPase